MDISNSSFWLSFLCSPKISQGIISNGPLFVNSRPTGRTSKWHETPTEEKKRIIVIYYPDYPAHSSLYDDFGGGKKGYEMIGDRAGNVTGFCEPPISFEETEITRQACRCWLVRIRLWMKNFSGGFASLSVCVFTWSRACHLVFGEYVR